MIRCYENFEKGNFYSDFYGIPFVEKFTEQVPKDTRWIDFSTGRNYYYRKEKKYNGIHFYCDDFKFNCIWNYPNRYINMLSEFDFVIMPDFSLYYDFPMALQLYNKYKNHWISCYYSQFGIYMIPNCNISYYANYDWSFRGFPKESVVAVSDIGRSKYVDQKYNKIRIIEHIFGTLKPIQVLIFTRSPNIYLNNVPDICNIITVDYKKR